MTRAGVPVTANGPLKQSSWHAIDHRLVAKQLDTGPSGLTGDEARRRFSIYGPNQFKERPPTSVWVVLLNQFRSPVIYILLIAGIVTAISGEHIDTAVIAVALLLNAIIGFTQERQAEASTSSQTRSCSSRRLLAWPSILVRCTLARCSTFCVLNRYRLMPGCALSRFPPRLSWRSNSTKSSAGQRCTINSSDADERRDTRRYLCSNDGKET